MGVKELVKTENHKLLSTGFFHIFSASVLNKILVFLSNIVVVRFVSKIDYGVFAYTDNILSMILLASGMGLVSGTFQLCSEKKNEEKTKIFQYGAVIGVRINVVICCALVLLSQVIPMKFASASEYLLLMSLNPILLIIFEFEQIYFRSRLENKKFSYASTLNTCLVVCGSIIGVICFTVKGMIIGRNIAYILTIVIICCRSKIPFSFFNKKNEISSEDKKALYKISIISMLNNGISQLLYIMDVFLLGMIIADEEIIASYKIATVIPTAMLFIPMAVVTYIYPYFASRKDDKQWCKEKYFLIIKYFGVFNLIISIIMIIFSKEILIFVYGEKYVDAANCFIILSISYFFSGTFKLISGNLLVTQRKLMFNLVVSIVAGLVNIIGNLILIPRYESMGAATTTLVVVLISSILSTMYYIHILKRKD